MKLQTTPINSPYNSNSSISGLATSEIHTY